MKVDYKWAVKRDIEQCVNNSEMRLGFSTLTAWINETEITE